MTNIENIQCKICKFNLWILEKIDDEFNHLGTVTNIHLTCRMCGIERVINKLQFPVIKLTEYNPHVEK